MDFCDVSSCAVSSVGLYVVSSDSPNFETKFADERRCFFLVVVLLSTSKKYRDAASETP